MSNSRFRLLLLAAAALLPGALHAAEPPAASFSIPQVDAMVAPVALFPDQVLAPMLVASAEPLQVVLADRWLRVPGNAALRGEALDRALAATHWSPCVRALVSVPQAIALLTRSLEWTVQLGYATSTQLDDVLDSVQRLRQRAAVAGALRSTDAFTVQSLAVVRDAHPAAKPAEAASDVERLYTLVDLADPRVAELPQYDPATVFGRWPYAQSRPVGLSLPVQGVIDASLGSAAAPIAELSPRYGKACTLDWASHRIDLTEGVATRPWHVETVSLTLGQAPPDGPVGVPGGPSGIPAETIGRPVVAVPLNLVQPSQVQAAQHAASVPLPVPRQALQAVRIGAPAVAIHPAPLPAEMDQAAPTALSDLDSGTVAEAFRERGAESRDRTPPMAAGPNRRGYAPGSAT